MVEMSDWRFICILPLVFVLLPAAVAHKSPTESYTLEGETMIVFTTRPLLPAVGEEVHFEFRLIPRGEMPLADQYDVDFMVYYDDSVQEWHGAMQH